eukprot:6206353-Pleurochrysis_carterae.AAC.2
MSTHIRQFLRRLFRIPKPTCYDVRGPCRQFRDNDKGTEWLQPLAEQQLKRSNLPPTDQKGTVVAAAAFPDSKTLFVHASLWIVARHFCTQVFINYHCLVVVASASGRAWSVAGLNSAKCVLICPPNRLKWPRYDFKVIWHLQRSAKKLAKACNAGRAIIK